MSLQEEFARARQSRDVFRVLRLARRADVFDDTTAELLKALRDSQIPVGVEGCKFAVRAGNITGYNWSKKVDPTLTEAVLDNPGFVIKASGYELGSLPLKERIRRLHIELPLDEYMQALEGFNLEELTILGEAHHRLSPDGARHIGNNSTIQKLILRGNELGLEGAKYIATLPRLRFLDISYNQTGDQGAGWLSTNKQITHLAVAGNELTDYAFYHMGEMDGLEYLDICNNNLTNQGLLDGASRFSALRTLVCWGNDAITLREDEPDLARHVQNVALYSDNPTHVPMIVTFSPE